MTSCWSAWPYFIDHAAGIGVLDRRDGRLLATHALPTGRGFQWGVAGTLAHHADVLVAADIEGVLMGFALDAMIQSSTNTTQANALRPTPTSLPPRIAATVTSTANVTAAGRMPTVNNKDPR